MKWYEYDEKNRIKNVYSKYNIEDFWKWWSDRDNKVMEVRIKDYKIVKETAKHFGIPYSFSGVFVWNHIMLKEVIKFVINKATVWFGVNPKRKNFNKWGTKSFGGLDVHTMEVVFLFMDIDRKIKNKPATSDELKNADLLAEMILERLGTEGWNKSYAKICSGHGVQLVVKLDFPIKVPNINFDDKEKIYVPNDEYEKIRLLISQGVGKDVVKFCKKHGKELGVEVDKSCFNMGRVGALPFSKNLKYNTERWRAIVELKDGVNDGLSDYILSKEEDVKLYNARNVFTKPSSLLPVDRIRKGKIKEHKLIKLMLENDFPEGYINNTLWLQVKCLLRDSKIDLRSKEFIKVHELLKKKHNRTFTLNFPEKRYVFNEGVINNYCVQNLIPPLYKLWPNRTKNKEFGFDKVSWDNIEFVSEVMNLKDDTSVIEDLGQCLQLLVSERVENVDVITSFIKGCLEKYGEKKTKYYYKYLFERFLMHELR